MRALIASGSGRYGDPWHPFPETSVLVARILTEAGFDTTVDDDVAAAQQPHTGQRDTWHVVAVEPPRRLAFRWHPYGVEPGVDHSTEPTTLVEFTLTETDGGVLLRIVESGFDAIPVERRATAFEANNQGWAAQTDLVRKYLDLVESE